MRPIALLLAALLLPAGALVGSAAQAGCAPQPVHGYVTSGTADVDAVGMRSGWGFVAMWDTNLRDCDGDGEPDFDGDHDLGLGGGAFGWGPWADEATCAYGLNVHGPFVTVTDLVVQDVPFFVGETDQSGPEVIRDEATGEVECVTDGAITPSTDADDCLARFVTRGRTCGTGGGDGLFWVFLASEVRDGPLGVRASGPTAGSIRASWEP